MAKAKIKLEGSVSFSDRSGNQWKRGDTRIITDEGDIRYYMYIPEFTVTMLQALAPKPVEKSASARAAAEDDEVDSAYTETDLKKQSKSGLIALGSEEFTLDLDMDLKKPEMIEAILAAQEAQTPDEGED